MRILMLTGNTSLQDGVNRHVLMVAGGLVRRGVEVGVCAVKGPGELTDALAKVGARAFTLGCANGHEWSVAPRFLRVMRSFRPDVAHVHMTAVGMGMVLRFLYPRTPVVQTEHMLMGAAQKGNFRRNPKLWWRWRLLPRVRRYIFVSQGLMDACGRGLQPAEVIYNPMSFDLPPRAEPSLRALLGVPEGTPVIGTACRIVREKNPEAFVRVMCAVLRERPDAHAAVMGAGRPALEAAIRAIAAADPAGARVHFLGYRPDAPRLVGELNCFLMTSWTEGLPTALLEAMRAHVPVALMEGNCGLKDIATLNAEEGPLAVVVPQGDEEALARGVVDTLAHPDAAKARAERAYAAAKQRYSIDLAAEKLEALYRRVLQEETQR